jgi:hypothetical protein
MERRKIVISSAARNLLSDQEKADSSAFASKEVPLGDGLGMTCNFEMASKY